MSEKVLETKFEQYKCCVIIPTYNNQKTIEQIIKDVLVFTSHIIVVNDGSTDATSEILSTFDALQIVSYPKNKGKGWALRQGFKEALKLGYENAITIDSDGQHFADDLPNFLDSLSKNKDTIIIGARNMNQDEIPGGSSFGNKFSNFWFKLETGISMPDTQSGYRLYPIKKLSKMIFFTKKYEFEIEIIVRAAWKGIKVIPVPIKIFYAPKNERISHFRPYKDFARVSVLNSILVILTVFYGLPVRLLRKIF